MPQAHEGFRLSPQQRRGWLLHQAAPVYRAGCAVSLEGALDAQRLRGALGAVVARHQILRTTFRRAAGVRVPIQVVEPAGGVAWREIDLGSEDAGRERIEEVFRAELAAPVDFDDGPLLRACLARLAPERSLLTLVLPALVTDGAGLRWLLHELAMHYGGRAGELPAEEDLVQYVQFSEWQHELRETDEGEEGRSFWSARPVPPEPVELGVESRREGDAPFEPASRPLSLPDAAVAGLERAATELEVTVADLLLAAWMTFLGRLGESSSPAVEVAFDGRSYDELAEAVGLFRKSIPVVGSMSWTSPFAELASRVGSTVEELAAWQDSFPVDDLARRSAVAFELQEWPAAATVGGLSFRPVHFQVRAEPAKLALIASRRPRGWTAELEYDAACFAARDVDRLALKLERLLAGIAADPGERLEDFDLLGDVERDELLMRFNATARDYPRDATLHELFARQAARTPDLPALRLAGDELSFRELGERVGRQAAVLRAAGVGPGRRVAVCLDRSFDLVASLLAILEAGSAYVPIDPLYPPQRIAFLMADARVGWVITRKRFISGLPAGEARVLTVEEDFDETPGDAAAPAATATAEDLAYVLYTSGSTGRPKGVMVPHRGVVNYLTWAIETYGLGEGGRVPVHSPAGFDLTVTSLFGPLLSGGCALLVPEESGIEGLGVELGQGGDFSLLKLTPSFLEVLNQLLDGDRMRGRSRLLVLGGEALSGHTLAAWRSASPETRLINEYGPTEAVVGCAVYELASAGELPLSVPIGRPIANARLYLLDGSLRPLPSGVRGHLHVAGDGLARGYLERPALTAERFIPDPFSEEAGGRLYRTGDLARFGSDGELDFLGRIDEQVKIRGYRIEPGEVEAVLVQHPGVEAAAVVAAGEAAEERRLVAYVVAEDELARGAELRSFLAEKLPEFMIPTAFVPLPAIPLTANGKVDRSALPELDPERSGLRAPYAAPRTPVEEILAAIWPQVLGLDAVGIDDNFFALGGDSIRSVRAVALAKERGIESAVEQLLQFQTIRELAREVKTYQASSIPPVRSRPFNMISEADRALLPPDAEDAYPLTSLQRGMLYHMELDHDYPLYHNVNTWHLRVPFDREIFLAAVREVVARHAVLRTSFDFTRYGEPLQIVHREADLQVGFDDLRDLDPADQHRELEEFWERERRRIFDLAEYPYCRLHLHRRSDDTSQFTLIESHAILDGWSTTSTLAEIFELYLDLWNGRTPPERKPLATSFADYVALERRALESQDCREYWQRHLAGMKPSPLLHRSPGSGGAAQEARQGKLHVDLRRPSLDALREIARSLAVPLRSVLLAMHLKMLSWATGRRDVVSGVVTNGRPEQLDGEQVRGLFLNTVPFRWILPDGSWADLVREVFEAEREMLPFRRYPLAAIQQQWGRGRLFDIGFTFLHFHSVARLLGEQEVEVLEDDEKDFSFASLLLNVTFFLSPTLDQLRVLLEYDGTELFRDQVAAVGDVLLRILERMSADPSALHHTDPLLSESERRQILDEWASGPPAPAARALQRLVFEQAARTPERPAVAAGDLRLSYADLESRSRRLAALLAARGLEPEAVVGILMERGAAVPVAILAVLEAGGAYLPLDPGSPGARLEFILRDANVSMVLTDETLGQRLEGFAGTVLCLDGEGRPGPQSGAPAEPSGGPRKVSPDRLAYVMYTSGSTGTPKGALVTHRGLSNYLLWARDAYRAAEGGGSLVHSSLAFDLTVTSLLTPLLAGGLVELIPGELALDGLAERLPGRADLSLLKLTPGHLNVLMRQLPGDQLAGRVRRLILGGESLGWEALHALRRAAPETEVINEYGPTETVVGCSAYPIPAGDEVPETGPVPIGRPIAGTRLYVLNAAGQPAPAGAAGELHVGGAGLARGYLARPAHTAASFVPDPLSGEAGARLYRTGDQARFLADGNLDFVGRADGQVKVRGYRVELGEVEAILQRLPEVREAAAGVLESDAGEALLVAYLVPRNGSVPPAAKLRAALLDRLPEYMVPSEFVELAEFPLTPNGKLDRRALPRPGLGRRRPEEELAPPETELQRVIAEIWKDVLAIDAVGIHESFFDLGGNSLRLFELGTKLRAAWSERPIQLVDLMRYPTIASLSEYLTSEAQVAAVVEADERSAKLARGREQLDEQFARLRRVPR